MAVAAKHRDTRSIVRELSSWSSARSPVGQSLCRQLANALVLYFNYKHYHWQTYDPACRDLHELFESLAVDVLNGVEPLAERIRRTRQAPPAHPIDAIDRASVSIAAPQSPPLTMRKMVEEADRNLLIVIKEMRQAVKTAEEHNDPRTVDLCSGLVQLHEKHHSWVRNILRTGEGLCETVASSTRRPVGMKRVKQR